MQLYLKTFNKFILCLVSLAAVLSLCEEDFFCPVSTFILMLNRVLYIAKATIFKWTAREAAANNQITISVTCTLVMWELAITKAKIEQLCRSWTRLKVEINDTQKLWWIYFLSPQLIRKGMFWETHRNNWATPSIQLPSKDSKGSLHFIVGHW